MVWRVILATILLLCVGIVVWGSALHFLTPPESEITVNGSPLTERYVDTQEALITITLQHPEQSAEVTTQLFISGAQADVVKPKSPKLDEATFVVGVGKTDVLLELSRSFGPFVFRRSVPIGIFYSAAQQAELTLNVPQVVFTNEISFEAAGPSGNNWELLLNGSVAKVEQSGALTIEINPVNNIARGTLKLPTPGTYTVQIRAKGSLRVSDEQQVIWRKALPAIQERRLHLELNGDMIRWTKTLRFTVDDPRPKRFLEGELSKEVLLKALMGEVTLNNTVWSSTSYSRLALQKVATGLELSVQSSRVELPNASRITVKHHGGLQEEAMSEIMLLSGDLSKVTGATPVADASEDNKITWTDVREVTLFVDRPLEQHRLLAIGPYEILPSNLAWVTIKLMALIPLFWLLVLLRHDFPEPSQANGRLRGDMIFLASITLLYPLIWLLHFIEHSDFVRAILPASGFGRTLGEPLDWSKLWLDARGLIAAYGVVVLALGAIWLAQRMAKALLVQTVLRDLRILTFFALLVTVPFTFADQLIHWLNLPAATRVLAENGATTGAAWLVCFASIRTVFARLRRRADAVSSGQITIPPAYWLAFLLVLMVAALPKGVGFDPRVAQLLSSHIASAIYTAPQALNLLSATAPLLGVALAFVCLAAQRSPDEETVAKGFALLVFAGVLVGTDEKWAVIPVSLVIALFVFPRVVTLPATREALLRRVKCIVRQDRAALVSALHEHSSQAKPKGGLFGLGLIGVSEEDSKHSKDYAPLEVKIPGADDQAPVLSRAADLVFSYGPHNGALRNGLAALRLGAYGSALFVAIYALPSFVQTDENQTFPVLSALVRVISIGGYWLIASFYFGYFFESLRGGTGWKKGAWLALGITLALTPIPLLEAKSAGDYAALLISTGQRFAFFMLLGLSAFDWATYKAHAGADASWRTFSVVTGASTFQALISVGLAGAGVAASSVLTGQVTSVLGDVAAALLPTASTISNTIP